MVLPPEIVREIVSFSCIKIQVNCRQVCKWLKYFVDHHLQPTIAKSIYAGRQAPLRREGVYNYRNNSLYFYDTDKQSLVQYHAPFATTNLFTIMVHEKPFRIDIPTLMSIDRQGKKLFLLYRFIIYRIDINSQEIEAKYRFGFTNAFIMLNENRIVTLSYEGELRIMLLGEKENIILLARRNVNFWSLIERTIGSMVHNAKQDHIYFFDKEYHNVKCIDKTGHWDVIVKMQSPVSSDWQLWFDETKDFLYALDQEGVLRAISVAKENIGTIIFTTKVHNMHGAHHLLVDVNTNTFYVKDKYEFKQFKIINTHAN